MSPVSAAAPSVYRQRARGFRSPFLRCFFMLRKTHEFLLADCVPSFQLARRRSFTAHSSLRTASAGLPLPPLRCLTLP